MIELVKSYDFIKEITPKVVELTKEHLLKSAENLEDDLSKVEINSDHIHPSVIGQEKSGLIIFTWLYKHLHKDDLKTYVGIYQPSIRKASLIFTDDRNIAVVNASVNSDHTLLAFSSVTRKHKAGYVSPGESGDIYQSYVAEIKPQNRIFSLNIEWRTLQKVMFIDSPSGSKVFHMLFFHHKESISLYHIPMSSASEDGHMMSKLPTTQQVVRQFLWSQFDQSSQRLYYIKLSPDEEDLAVPFLVVVQFRSNGEMHYDLNVTLPIQMSMGLMSQQAVYFEHYLSTCVSSSLLNLNVLTANSGLFYICYQYPPSEPFPHNISTDDDSSRESTPEIRATDSSVTYDVLCIHSGYSVRCSSMVETAKLTNSEQSRVSFFMFNDYLMVFLPGSFLHVLDISNEHDPVHNILIKTPSLLPSIAGWDIASNGSVLLSVGLQNIFNSGPTLLWENKTQSAYNVEPNMRSLITLFSNSNPATRLAILHASVVHLKESKVTRKVIERICLDPANMETADLIKEYLIAAPYYHLKKSVAHQFDLKPFPFTSQEVWRGQCERDENGNRIVFLYYKKFKSDLLNQILKQLSRNREDFWINIRSNLHLEGDKNFYRFHLHSLNSAAVDMDSSIRRSSNFSSYSQSRQSMSTTNERSSTSRNLQHAVRVNEKNDESKKENPKQSQLPREIDSTKAAERQRSEDAYKKYITVDKLVKHITKIQGSEVKPKAIKMSREYAEIRGKIMRSLWKCVMKSLNFSTDASVISVSLHLKPSQHEAALFQIVERLKIVSDQLCFPGFHNMNQVFCLLGFRYLSRYQFSQYLEAKIFDIYPGFVKRVLCEVPNDEEYLKMKIQIASCLGKEDAISALKVWDHPIGNRYIAQQHISRVNVDNTTFSLGGAPTSFDEEPSEQFVPLHTLIEAMKVGNQQSKRGWGRPNMQLTEEDFDAVAVAALTETESLRNICID